MKKIGCCLAKFIVFSGLCFLSHSIFAANAVIQNIRFVPVSENQMRLILSSSGPLQYHLFELDNPDRLVIDFKQAQLTYGLNKQTVKSNFIKQLRSSQQGNSLRLVFDLKNAVGYKSFVSNEASVNRLTINLSLKANIPKPSINNTAILSSAHKTLTPSAPAYQDYAMIGSKDVVIVIDPGHGGKDTGAIGQRGSYEKNDVLAISKQLQNLINHQKGFKAVLTRRSDYYLTLRQRLNLARRYKADMFIAIHADAFRNHQARGASVYALSGRGATSEAARWLAERENQSELMGGVELNDKDNMLKSVLLNLSQTATIQSGLTVGYQLLISMGRICPLHHRKVEQAAFVVLKSPDIPSVLVECGFISNGQEESRLANYNYQRQIANALSQGITSYFKLNPPRGTWLAKQQAYYQH